MQTQDSFLLQWPTLITLIMFPIMLVVYVRLARSEDRASATRDARMTPGFFPRRLGRNERSVLSI